MFNDTSLFFEEWFYMDGLIRKYKKKQNIKTCRKVRFVRYWPILDTLVFSDILT